MPHGSHRFGFLASVRTSLRRARSACRTRRRFPPVARARRTSPRTGTSFPLDRGLRPAGRRGAASPAVSCRGRAALVARKTATAARGPASASVLRPPEFRARTRAPSATRPCPASPGARPRRRRCPSSGRREHHPSAGASRQASRRGPNRARTASLLVRRARVRPRRPTTTPAPAEQPSCRCRGQCVPAQPRPRRHRWQRSVTP